MTTYTVATYDDSATNGGTPSNASLKGAVATANASSANDTINLAADLTLTADQTAATFATITPNGSGTLRFNSSDPTVAHTLTLTGAVNIVDDSPTTPQPSFTVGGPITLQIGDGTTNGSIAGNLRVDDGGMLTFNNTTDTTYTGTLSVEDDDDGLFNAQAGTTVTLDGTQGTAGLAIRASQNSNPDGSLKAANPYDLEIGGAGNGLVTGIIGDSGLAATAGNLTKSGAGTWTFAGANTYVGTTTVEGGTLVISNSAGLGGTIGSGNDASGNPATAAEAGTIVADGATLALKGGISIGAEALTLGAASTDDDAGGATNADDDTPGLLNISGNNSFAGNITLASDATVESSAGTLTLTGAISGAGAVNDQGNAFNPGLTLSGDGDGSVTGAIDANVGTLTKDGDGFWTLSGANAYIGTTTVEEGTLVVSNSAALGDTTAGTVVEDGATLSLEATTNSGALTIGDNLTLSGEGALGDDPGEDAAGALSNEDGDNTVTGNITLAADATIKSEGGSLTLSGTVGGAFGLTLDGDANGTVSGAIGSDVTSVTKNGDGTWALTSANNAYAGGTTINDGTLELGTMTSASTGAITFGDDSQTLQLDSSGTLANVLTNFEEDDTIDLRTINSDGATVTINGNKVTVTETMGGTDSVTLTFAGDVPSNFSAVLTSDGQGGTDLRLDDVTAPDTPLAPKLTAASDTGTSSTDGITRDNTPTLTGTAEADSTVTLYDVDENGNATAVGTATADDNGVYSVTATTLADGTHALSVTSTDAHGNESDLSAPTDVTIDTHISAPTTLKVAAASDSGRSPTDAITKVKTPIITGSAEPFSVVTLFDGTKIIGSAIVPASGNFTFTSPSLTDGVHNISAIATDAAGNFSQASAVLSVTIDTKAPATPAAPTLATDSGVSATDKITNVQTPTFTGTTEAGATVTLYDGTTAIGSVTAGSTGAYSVTSTQTLTNGVHKIKVTATDAAGNTSLGSAINTVTIDSVAPAAPATPTLVATSDTGISKTDKITNDSTPSITGKTEPYATVTFYNGTGTTPLGTATASSAGVYTFTPTTPLADGTYNFTLTATDRAGNTSVRTTTPLSVTIDTTAPTAPAAPTLDAASDTGSSQTDGITKDTTPTLSGTAENGATVTLYEGAKVLGTTTASATTGAYSITSSALANGSHNLTVKATDAAGNVSVASAPTAVTVDTVAPTAPKITLENDTGVSAKDRITSDPTLDIAAEAGTTLTYSTDGKTYSATEPTFTDGVNKVYVKATDAAGNTSAAGSLTFTLDTTNPDVDITSAGGTVATAKQTIVGTGEAGSTVTLTDNDNTVGTALVAANGKWSKAVTLTSGTNSITASAVDKAGNQGATDTVAYNYTPSAFQASSHHSMIQAMSTMTGSSSSSMTPSAAASGSEAHPLAVAHA